MCYVGVWLLGILTAAYQQNIRTFALLLDLFSLLRFLLNFFHWFFSNSDLLNLLGNGFSCDVLSNSKIQTNHFLIVRLVFMLLALYRKDLIDKVRCVLPNTFFVAI